MKLMLVVVVEAVWEVTVVEGDSGRGGVGECVVEMMVGDV